MTGPVARTRAVYDREAARYAEAFVTLPNDPILADFIADLPAGARVLDLGSGVGHAAAAMRDAGLEVTAFDASPGMAEVARARFGLDVIVGDFDDVPKLGRFAGVWAMFSLMHAPRSDMPRHLKAGRAALIHGGRFVIGMKTAPREGAGVPEAGDERDALGRRYAYVTEAVLDALLAEAGFTPLARAHGASAGLDGVAAPWVIVTAHG